MVLSRAIHPAFTTQDFSMRCTALLLAPSVLWQSFHRIFRYSVRRGCEGLSCLASYTKPPLPGIYHMIWKTGIPSEHSYIFWYLLNQWILIQAASPHFSTAWRQCMSLVIAYSFCHGTSDNLHTKTSPRGL